jgi:hypothetical protein
MVNCQPDEAEIAQRFDAARGSDPRVIAPCDHDQIDRSQRHHRNIGRTDRIGIAEEIERAVENVLREFRARRSAFDRDAGRAFCDLVEDRRHQQRFERFEQAHAEGSASSASRGVREIARSRSSGFSYITYLNKEFQKLAAAR